MSRFICASILLLAACSPEPPSVPSSLGGAAGDDGEGGIGGQAGDVEGGGGGGGLGLGGSAGSGGFSWLDDDSLWRETTATSEAANARVRESLPGKLRYPRLQWRSCGLGCEFVEFDAAVSPTLGTVAIDDGERAVLSYFTYPGRRVVDLSNGETISVLRGDSLVEAEESRPRAWGRGSDPNLTLLYSNDRALESVFDHHAGAWDFKLPWGRPNNACDIWSVDTSPPTIFYGCGGSVGAMATAGSNVITWFKETETFGAGAGNAGLSVWSELNYEPPTSSRIRGWDGTGASRLIVGEMPGIACALSVSPQRILGLRSGDPSQFAKCHSFLPMSEVWSVSRVDGTLESWQLPEDEPLAWQGSSTSGDFAAMLGATEVEPDLSYLDRARFWLLRLSDGKLRRFTATPGFTWDYMRFTVDSDYLYIGEGPPNRGSMITRLTRYSLEHFDEIGLPVEEEPPRSP